MTYSFISASDTPQNEGDTTTIRKTLEEAKAVAREINERGVKEVVADKGYHSGAVLTEMHEREVRSYIPGPERGRRNWQGEGKAEEQKRTYENRRRVRADRNKPLQRLRSELTERNFAHPYETGGMRRVHLRGLNNILKRLLVHGAAFNLFSDPAENCGSGHAQAVTGAYAAAVYTFGRPLFVVLFAKRAPFTSVGDGGLPQ